MLADICIEKIKNKEASSAFKIAKIADLYMAFIEIKIRIQLEEKSNREMSREKPQKLERVKENILFRSFQTRLVDSIGRKG
jgi:hypothetical protein